MRKADMTQTDYVALGIKLFGPRYRARPPSGIFYFHGGRVLFNVVTAEVVIGDTVINLRDLVQELAERKTRTGSSERATVNQYIAEVLEPQKPPDSASKPHLSHGRGA